MKPYGEQVFCNDAANRSASPAPECRSVVRGIKTLDFRAIATLPDRTINEQETAGYMLNGPDAS